MIGLLDSGKFLTLALSAGTNNNVDVTQGYSFIMDSTPGAAFSITGFSIRYDAAEDANHAGFRLINNSGYACTLKHNSGSSTTQHKILSYTGADIVLADQEAVFLAYDDIGLRWHIIAIASVPTQFTGTIAEFGFAATLPSAGVTRYAYPNGVAALSSTVAITVEFKISVPGTIKSLYIETDVAPGAIPTPQTFQATIFKNGSSGGVTCTVTAANTTASDLSNTFTVSAGDLITVQLVPSATCAALNVTGGFLQTV